MSNITLKGIAQLLKLELEPINRRLGKIEKTLEVHTRALDQLLKEKKDREVGDVVVIHRFERLESWAKQAGEKIGVKLEL